MDDNKRTTRKGNNISLLGFMGTGKTSVGKLLSQKLKRESLDTDEILEKETAMTIVEIFEQEGEAYFRRIEKDLIKRLSQETDKIILCGGGAVLDIENIRNLRKGGITVLLEAEPEEIHRRIQKDQTRPLLKGKMNLKTIKEILEQRQKAYLASGDIVVKTTNKSLEEVSDEIIKQLKKEYQGEVLG